MSGRFIDLLPAADQARAADALRRLAPMSKGGMLAQLSFPPGRPHLENVARAPALLPTVISLAEHGSGDHDSIPLADLAVTADRDALYVVSMSRRRGGGTADGQRGRPPGDAPAGPHAGGDPACLYGRTVALLLGPGRVREIPQLCRARPSQGDPGPCPPGRAPAERPRAGGHRPRAGWRDVGGRDRLQQHRRRGRAAACRRVGAGLPVRRRHRARLSTIFRVSRNRHPQGQSAGSDNPKCCTRTTRTTSSR